jgi:hypothetical protein
MYFYKLREVDSFGRTRERMEEMLKLLGEELISTFYEVGVSFLLYLQLATRQPTQMQ